MDTVQEILDSITDKSVEACQENVETVRENAVVGQHLRMIAYDDMITG